jgi:uncharacterized protein
VPGRPREQLTADQARRLALAAQGLLRPGPARATPSTLRATLGRLGAIQIDSINVVARAHELVLAARLGEHRPELFDQVVYRHRAGFEYWGHAASYLPIGLWRLFLPRMRRTGARDEGWWTRTRGRHAQLYPRILDRLRREGPLAASAFREAGGPRRGAWWDWAPAKSVLEDLFAQGQVMVHDRVRFERRYDLTERVLPPGVDTTAPTTLEADLGLLLHAAGAQGVATAADLADYYRQRPEHFQPALAEAVSAGLLLEVAVQGWPVPAYVLPGVRLPRAVRHEPVLLGPFDSLIWHRGRTRRLFGFDYRLEIYVPAPRRVHGYYTMAVLADGHLLARVDPKLDRRAGRLLVRAAHLEPGADPAAAAAAVVSACERLAAQLGAADLELPATLTTPPAGALTARPGPGPLTARPGP